MPNGTEFSSVAAPDGALFQNVCSIKMHYWFTKAIKKVFHSEIKVLKINDPRWPLIFSKVSTWHTFESPK